MSQVSQAFYCHCCQVGFSMTSQKCNGKTLPVKEWKKLLRTLLWWSVGGLEMTASLGEIPRVLQILVLFVRYKFQPLADNGCALMRGKSGGTLEISPARAYFTNLPYREPPSTTRVSRLNPGETRHRMWMKWWVEVEKTGPHFITRSVCAGETLPGLFGRMRQLFDVRFVCQAPIVSVETRKQRNTKPEYSSQYCEKEEFSEITKT